MPFQLDLEPDQFDYYPASGAVGNLRAMTAATPNIQVHQGAKTLEYEIGLLNAGRESIVTDALPHANDLRALAANKAEVSAGLSAQLTEDERNDLERIPNCGERERTRFAALYLRCAEGVKGEHAFALEQQLQRAVAADGEFECPEYIRNAILWVTPRADRTSVP